MRSVMRASILIALPGAIFAPLIPQIHGVSFCNDGSDNDGLQIVPNVLPPCPTQTPTALIVVVAIVAAAIMAAWSLAPLYASRAAE